MYETGGFETDCCCKPRRNTSTMKSMIKYLSLTIMLLVFGCNQKHEQARVNMANPEMDTPTSEQKTKETVERKLIKEGRVEFETASLSATRKTIFEAVKK